MAKKLELTIHIWDNGHIVNAQIVDYSKEESVLTASGKTFEDVFAQIGEHFMWKSGKVPARCRQKDSGVF